MNPNYGRISAIQWIGSSEYNALEAKLTQNMTHGVQVQGSYTYGKSMDTSSTSVGTDAFQNSLKNPQWFYPDFNRSVSDFDVRQNLIVNVVWTIGGTPSASDHGLKTAAIRGWEFGTIFQAATGIPFNAILGGDPTGQLTSVVQDLPDLLPGAGCGDPVNPGHPLNYIKVQCLAFPNPVNRQGDIGRNALTGPGLLELDASVDKTTYITRTLSAQFRIEAFNAINHTNFGLPIANQVVFSQSGAPVPGAGQITSTSNPAREIQAAVKFIF